jgi:hypothetical protein
MEFMQGLPEDMVASTKNGAQLQMAGAHDLMWNSKNRFLKKR